MAFAFGAHAEGDVSAEVMAEPWSSGECVRVDLATSHAYLTRDEAVKLHALLGAVLAQLPPPSPVAVEVDDNVTTQAALGDLYGDEQ